MRITSKNMKYYPFKTLEELVKHAMIVAFKDALKLKKSRVRFFDITKNKKNANIRDSVSDCI